MVQPDALDRKILRELESPGSFQWNIRESFASIAKKIGVDEETVRKRVTRMRDASVLTGWELIINPHLINRESASLELEVSDLGAKQRAISQIKLIDGVISILDFHGASLQVGIYYRHESALGKQISLMEAICNCKHSMLWNITFPSCDLKMTKTDWHILEILRKDPRRKLGEISAASKASVRTVNRRLTRMVDDYAFFLHALIDFKKLGGLPYRLMIHSIDQKKKEQIDEFLLSNYGEKIEWSYTFSNEYSMFVMYCENVGEASQVIDSVHNLKGPIDLRMDIIEDQITVQGWIDDEIAAKISEA